MGGGAATLFPTFGRAKEHEVQAMPDERDDERELFAALRRTGDDTLRNRLIEDHLWLARHCARRFGGKGQSPEDLEQVASVALIKAVDRFDPSFKVRFATFAVPTITGELRRHFRDRGWSMRVSRRLKDLHLELRAAGERLAHELGRRPTLEELAESVDCSVEEVLEALEAGAAYRSKSLSAPSSADDAPEIVPGADDVEMAGTDARVAVQEALQTLPDRERRVVYLRFYLGLTQSEIADEIGVSQVHVSRILRATLAHLEEELGEEGADLMTSE